MPLQFEKVYRVKARANLADPEFWNTRFSDIDVRVSKVEESASRIDSQAESLTAVALERLNIVLGPALTKIAYASEQGFLLAHSDTSISLSDGETVEFVIGNEAERELFAPSPFVTIAREANTSDYAFGRTLAYSKETGVLSVQINGVFGSEGPFDDWVIYAGAAIADAVKNWADAAQSAAASAISAKSDTIGYANDASAALGHRNAAEAAKTAAETAAATAESYAESIDPESIQDSIDSKVSKAGGENLTGGFTADSPDAGTKSSGTFTPNPALGNLQRVSNGGAHAIAPPAGNCSMVLRYTNVTGAGALTTSGFNLTTGTFSTTVGARHLVYVTKIDGDSHIHIAKVAG